MRDRSKTESQRRRKRVKPPLKITELHTSKAEPIGAEEKLKESEGHYQQLFESIREGFALCEVVLDKKGKAVDYRFLKINPAFAEQSGMNIKITVGKTIKELFPDIEPRWIQRYCNVAINQKPIHFIDYNHNTNRYYDAFAFPVTKEKFSMLFRDITDRKVAEAEREKLMEVLIEKNRELEEIIRVATHDLRTPMVNIEGFAQILATSCEQIHSLAEKQKVPDQLGKQLKEVVGEDIPEAVGIINSGVSKMKSLLDGLLRVAKLGYSATRMVEVDMNAKLANIIDTMKFQVKQSGAQIKIDKPLPSCLGDQVQINQIFSNLLVNALKYLDPSRPGRVRITGWIEENYSVYCVEDNGIGIAEDEIDNIFRMFYRIGPAGDDGEGLGLAIVRRIVNRHHGEVWAESERRKGSKFFVKLPRQ